MSLGEHQYDSSGHWTVSSLNPYFPSPCSHLYWRRRNHSGKQRIEGPHVFTFRTQDSGVHIDTFHILGRGYHRDSIVPVFKKNSKWCFVHHPFHVDQNDFRTLTTCDEGNNTIRPQMPLSKFRPSKGLRRGVVGEEWIQREVTSNTGVGQNVS